MSLMLLCKQTTGRKDSAMIPREGTDQRQREDDLCPPVQDHHIPALSSGSIYSDVEVLVLGPWQKIRQRLLKPVAFVLSHVGISANLLSYASVLFGLGFCLLASFQFEIAFWLLVASIVCDGLDGVEARSTHTNTERGSFTDVCC